MLNTKFSPWPSFTDDEASAVQRVLLSNRVNYWTGEEARHFENDFASWVGSRYAIALANGTVAIDLALKALNVGPGDEVVVTPRTFIATVSSVVNIGATPIFADVDSQSGNITAKTIKKVLTPRTKAIICVHLAGWPCDMDPIMLLANACGLRVIEDCAQAHGARYAGRSVGSIGHIGAWSFCQDKIMTTGGEGGMVTTNDKLLWQTMWSYKDHGKSYEQVYDRSHESGYRWVHESFGTNLRMLEMQAAIGRIQLRRMTDWSAKRNKNAEIIWNTCRQFPALRVPDFYHADNKASSNEKISCLDYVHANYKCYVYIRENKLNAGWSRNRIIEEINALEVPCYYGSCPEVYLERAFDTTGWRPQIRLPVAKELGETSLMFLVHPTLTDQEIQKTCQAINSIMIKASKNK